MYIDKNDLYLSNWIFRYQFVLGLLCKERPSEELVRNYLTLPNNEGVADLQDWCYNKTHIDWVYGINIIDSADILVKNEQ